MTKPLSHIAQMSPYALADISAPDGMDLISLSQNESLRAPSPHAIKAAADSLADGASYPDPDWKALRRALGALQNIPPEMILCGNGSLDLIGCLARVFAGPNRAILAPVHAYPFFRTVAQMVHARFDTAEEVGCTVDVDALLTNVRDDTAIVFVANPGNPTGTRIAKSELLRLRAGLRDDILLVIDEAYGEFADHLDERSWDMVVGGNCVVLRTFSKAYSMAGFRVGWGLFPVPIAEQVRKVMNPNILTSASQAAACAAVQDQDYMRDTCAITATLRDCAAQTLQAAGFDVLPSVTNFLLMRFADSATALSLDANLRAQGIFLRLQQGAGLPHALRMTIGPEAKSEQAIAHLKRWRKENPQ